MKLRHLVVVVIIAGLVGVVGPLGAQQVRPDGSTAEPTPLVAGPPVTGGPNAPGNQTEWGTAGWSGWSMGPCDAFVSRGTGVAAKSSNCESIEASADGTAYIAFPVHIPQGAIVQYARIYFYANDAALRIGASFRKLSTTGVGTTIQILQPAATAAGDANEQFGPFSETIDQSPATGYTYSVIASLPKSGASITKIYKIYLYYKLQISPSPASASFTDVPTSYWAFQGIEALKASGITTGCNPPTNDQFCPEMTVTRAQMAMFLARSLGLHWQY